MDLKDTYTSVFLKAAGQTPSENTIKKFRNVWWQNVRGKDTGGLRLTDQALEFVEEHSQIKTYKVEIPKEISITPQILVWLDQFIESPYHLTKKHIIVLKEKSAFELYLFHGDVRKMGYAKAMHQRLSQES
jgi:hypothetical protein